MSGESDGRSAFRPLAPPRNLTEALVVRLREEITEGRLAPNERLPTEQEMIASFGVSRTVVREAIAALRAQGLVESRQGAGVFVSGDPRRRPLSIDPRGVQTLAGVLQLMELRMAVEIEAAGLAAERRTGAQMRGIGRTLKGFEKAIEAGGDAVDADYDFHCAVGAGTNNPFFLECLQYLGSFIIPRRNIHVASGGEQAQRVYLQGVLDEHRRIAAAIDAKDPRRAREAMRAHLEHGRERYRKLEPGRSARRKETAR